MIDRDDMERAGIAGLVLVLFFTLLLSSEPDPPSFRAASRFAWRMHGTLRSESGWPIAGARLESVRRRSLDASSQAEFDDHLGSTTTDREGRFEIACEGPGVSFEIIYGLARACPESEYVAALTDRARPIDLVLHDAFDVELKVIEKKTKQPVPGCTIRGAVRDAEGHIRTLGCWGTQFEFVGSTDPQGRIRFRSPALLRAQVVAEGFQPCWIECDLAALEDRDPSFDVEISRIGRIEGSIDLERASMEYRNGIVIATMREPLDAAVRASGPLRCSTAESGDEWSQPLGAGARFSLDRLLSGVEYELSFHPARPDAPDLPLGRYVVEGSQTLYVGRLVPPPPPPHAEFSGQVCVNGERSAATLTWRAGDVRTVIDVDSSGDFSGKLRPIGDGVLEIHPAGLRVTRSYPIALVEGRNEPRRFDLSIDFSTIVVRLKSHPSATIEGVPISILAGERLVATMVTDASGEAVWRIPKDELARTFTIEVQASGRQHRVFDVRGGSDPLEIEVMGER